MCWELAGKGLDNGNKQGTGAHLPGLGTGRHWEPGGLGAWRDDQVFVLRKALWLWWSGWISFREERKLLSRFVGGLNRDKDGEDGEEGWTETC